MLCFVPVASVEGCMFSLLYYVPLGKQSDSPLPWDFVLCSSIFTAVGDEEVIFFPTSDMRNRGKEKAEHKSIC